MIANMMIEALRPHVPEYTDVVMAELAKPQSQKGLKESFRGVLTEGVKNTFSTVDMTVYSSILKRHGCPSGAVCEQTLGQQIAEAEDQEWAYRELIYRGDAELLDANAIKKAGSPRNAAALLLEVWEAKYPETRD